MYGIFFFPKKMKEKGEDNIWLARNGQRIVVVDTQRKIKEIENCLPGYLRHTYYKK